MRNYMCSHECVEHLQRGVCVGEGECEGVGD